MLSFLLHPHGTSLSQESGDGGSSTHVDRFTPNSLRAAHTMLKAAQTGGRNNIGTNCPGLPWGGIVTKAAAIHGTMRLIAMLAQMWSQTGRLRVATATMLTLTTTRVIGINPIIRTNHIPWIHASGLNRCVKAPRSHN